MGMDNPVGSRQGLPDKFMPDTMTSGGTQQMLPEVKFKPMLPNILPDALLGLGTNLRNMADAVQAQQDFLQKKQDEMEISALAAKAGVQYASTMATAQGEYTTSGAPASGFPEYLMQRTQEVNANLLSQTSNENVAQGLQKHLNEMAPGVMVHGIQTSQGMMFNNYKTTVDNTIRANQDMVYQLANEQGIINGVNAIDGITPALQQKEKGNFDRTLGENGPDYDKLYFSAKGELAILGIHGAWDHGKPGDTLGSINAALDLVNNPNVSKLLTPQQVDGLRDQLNAAQGRELAARQKILVGQTDDIMENLKTATINGQDTTQIIEQLKKQQALGGVTSDQYEHIGEVVRYGAAFQTFPYQGSPQQIEEWEQAVNPDLSKDPSIVNAKDFSDQSRIYHSLRDAAAKQEAYYSTHAGSLAQKVYGNGSTQTSEQEIQQRTITAQAQQGKDYGDISYMNKADIDDLNAKISNAMQANDPQTAIQVFKGMVAKESQLKIPDTSLTGADITLHDMFAAAKDPSLKKQVAAMGLANSTGGATDFNPTLVFAASQTSKGSKELFKAKFGEKANYDDFMDAVRKNPKVANYFDESQLGIKGRELLDTQRDILNKAIILSASGPGPEKQGGFVWDNPLIGDPIIKDGVAQHRWVIGGNDRLQSTTDAAIDTIFPGTAVDVTGTTTPLVLQGHTQKLATPFGDIPLPGKTSDEFAYDVPLPFGQHFKGTIGLGNFYRNDPVNISSGKLVISPEDAAKGVNAEVIQKYIGAILNHDPTLFQRVPIKGQGNGLSDPEMFGHIFNDVTLHHEGTTLNAHDAQGTDVSKQGTLFSSNRAMLANPLIMGGKDKVITKVEDMDKLTVAQSAKIAYLAHWLPSHVSKYKDPALQAQLFDIHYLSPVLYNKVISKVPDLQKAEGMLPTAENLPYLIKVQQAVHDAQYKEMMKDKAWGDYGKTWTKRMSENNDVTRSMALRKYAGPMSASQLDAGTQAIRDRVMQTWKGNVVVIDDKTNSTKGAEIQYTKNGISTPIIGRDGQRFTFKYSEAADWYKNYAKKDINVWNAMGDYWNEHVNGTHPAGGK